MCFIFNREAIFIIKCTKLLSATSKEAIILSVSFLGFKKLQKQLDYCSIITSIIISGTSADLHSSHLFNK